MQDIKINTILKTLATIVSSLHDDKAEENFAAFCRQRVIDMNEGRVKFHGNDYAKGTLHSYKVFTNLIERFSSNTSLKWECLSSRTIDEFIHFMEKSEYMKKTINKNLSLMSALLTAADREGYIFDTNILKHFPRLRVTKDDKMTEIYLTEDELEHLALMPLEGRDLEVRDTFLLGCYTCQRYSDYSSITERNISFHDGICMINIIQQKTGNEVSIPITNKRMLDILKKYHYRIPHISNIELNDKIKKIARRLSVSVPSLCECTETLLTLDIRRREKRTGIFYKRTENTKALVPRYDLITTHTARRTGITLMYLNNIYSTHEMMSISGHRSEKVFYEYIKLSKTELATNIARKTMRRERNITLMQQLTSIVEHMDNEQIMKLLRFAHSLQKLSQQT